MARNKKRQLQNVKEDGSFSFTQEINPHPIYGEAFDLILHFENSIDQPQLYTDENIKLVLEGLIEKYGVINVRVNWFSDGLTVYSPNASRTEQDALREMLETDSSNDKAA